MIRKKFFQLVAEWDRVHLFEETYEDLWHKLEGHTNKYLQLTVNELLEEFREKHESGDPHEAKLRAEVKLKDDPKQARKDLGQELKAAFGCLLECKDYLDNDDDIEAFNCLIKAATAYGRVLAYERVDKLIERTADRSKVNRSNALSNRTSQLKRFIIEKIQFLPPEKRISLQDAIEHLASEIAKKAKDVKDDSPWDGLHPFVRIKSWASQDKKFNDSLNQALQGRPSQDIFGRLGRH